MDGDIYLALIRIATVLPVLFLRWTSLYMAIVIATSLTLFVLIVVPAIPGVSSDGPRFRSLVSYPMTVLFSIALFGKLGGMLHVAGAVWCMLAVADGGALLVRLLAEKTNTLQLDEANFSRLMMGFHFTLGATSSVIAAYWISRGSIPSAEHLLVVVPAAIAYTYASCRENVRIEEDYIRPLLIGLFLYALYLMEYSVLAENLYEKGKTWIGWFMFSTALWWPLGHKWRLAGKSISFWVVCSGCAGYFGSWRLFVLFLSFSIVSIFSIKRQEKYRLDPKAAISRSENDEDIKENVPGRYRFYDSKKMENNLRTSSVVAVICAFLALAAGIDNQNTTLPAGRVLFQFASVLAIAVGASRISGDLVAGFLGHSNFSLSDLKIVDSQAVGSDQGIIVLEEQGGSLAGALVITTVAAILGLISGFSEFILIPSSILFLRLAMRYFNIIAPLPATRETLVETLGIIILGIVIRMAFP